MSHLEVHAHLKVRPGQDGTECEVHEAYVNEDGLFEHNTHVLEARTILFRDFAFDHRMTVFGDVSQRLKDLAVKHAGGITVYAFLEGLRETATV